MIDDAGVSEPIAVVDPVVETVANVAIEPTPDPVVDDVFDAAPEVAVEVAVEAEPVTPVDRTIEERVEVGSIIERTPRGWMARLMYGGAIRMHGEGDTIDAAVAAAGA